MKPTNTHILMVNNKLRDIKNEILRRKGWRCNPSQVVVVVDKITDFGLVTYKASAFSHRKKEKPLVEYAQVSSNFKRDRYFDEHLLREICYEMIENIEAKLVTYFFQGKKRK